jgi:hypothetical protein
VERIGGAVVLSLSFYLSVLFLLKHLGEYSRVTLLQFVGVALSISGFVAVRYTRPFEPRSPMAWFGHDASCRSVNNRRAVGCPSL